LIELTGSASRAIAMWRLSFPFSRRRDFTRHHLG
jgi:hypothetical protein